MNETDGDDPPLVAPDGSFTSTVFFYVSCGVLTLYLLIIEDNTVTMVIVQPPQLATSEERVGARCENMQDDYRPLLS